MLKELRKIERSKSNYIRALQYKGSINAYLNDKGYVCYDPVELRNFQKTHKRGRPPKVNITIKGE